MTTIDPPGTNGRAYVAPLNAVLRPSGAPKFSAVDIFCGAGGLSLGFRAHGFEVAGFDSDVVTVKTYSRNVGEGVVSSLDEGSIVPRADVLLAGPPCQPWSRAGTRLGEADHREGLRVTASIMERTKPRVLVIENVPGLARGSGRRYLDALVSRIEASGYRVFEREMNAADFGVPQNRRRVFVVATRRRTFEFPDPLPRPISAGTAIGRSARKATRSPRWLTPGMEAYVRRYEQASKCKHPRDLHLDRPSRTLTVRNLVGATGDMLRVQIGNGKRRRLTVHEAARLQSFPDWFKFAGLESKQFEQIGNAVPPLLSYHIAGAVLAALEGREIGA